MADVIVLGSLNIDLVARVGHLPSPGESVTAVDFLQRPGGKGANQAAAAARAGASTRLIGCVGADDEGTMYRNALKTHSVDVCGVRAVSGEVTGRALIVVDCAGENHIVVVPGANGFTSEPEVRALHLRPDDVLLLQHEVPAPTVRAAARAAREAGCTVLLNPSPWRGLDRVLFDDCDALIVNVGEAEKLRDEGYDTSRAIITAGGEGASWGDLHVDAAHVAVLDTTGAGDAFAGTLAAALAQGRDRDAALHAGVAAGGRAVTHEGAQPWSF
ncbi:MAG: PfkB family carbohydrate kinase [Actinomycetota bacterium]|nr:PfkB family carbohydrate kinase [Actinomycetota bacterium]